MERRAGLVAVICTILATDSELTSIIILLQSECITWDKYDNARIMQTLYNALDPMLIRYPPPPPPTLMHKFRCMLPSHQLANAAKLEPSSPNSHSSSCTVAPLTALHCLSAFVSLDCSFADGSQYIQRGHICQTPSLDWLHKDTGFVFHHRSWSLETYSAWYDL